ncbi:MAG: murein biosynthesis integral membrane protein MurJ [Parachlamydiales bacterium]|jgi:putative peptidoglycan lipid II flippase
MKQDTFKTIARSARHFLSGTVLSRVTGLIRDVATAYAFGADASVAAFLVAFRFSHLFRRILGEGALQGAFTPRYEKLKHEDPVQAALFYRDLQYGLGSLLFVFILFSIGILQFANGWSGLSAGNHEIILLTTYLMPGLFFICLYGLNASLLQCESKYLLSSAVPSLLNLGWTVGVLLLTGLPSAQAMPWLALCVVLATGLQWAATVPACRSIVHKLAPQMAWRSWDIYSLNVKALVKPMLLTIAGVAATQVNSATDALFARYADLEGPAYLWYAIRLQQLPLALFGIAIGNAILPPLARAAREGNQERFQSFIRYAWKATLALMIPITLGIFLFGGWAIQLIFGHGDFNSQDAAMTFYCLEGYAIGLIPSALVICHLQGFFARGDYKTPMRASLGSVVCNTFLNALFIFGLGWGSVSVAIATGISAWVNLGLFYVFRPKLSPLFGEAT